MPFEKGHRRTGGRKKGTPNRTSAEIKAVIAEAFDELGGVAALVAWARRNPDFFYGKLWIRLLPKELAVQHSGTLDLADVIKRARERAKGGE